MRLTCVGIIASLLIASVQLVAQEEVEVSYVTGEQVKVWIADGVDFTVVDVRDENDGSLGVIPDSLVLPLQRGEAGMAEMLALLVDEIVKVTDRDDKIVLICGSGFISSRTFKPLKEAGYTDVHVFSNGVYGTRSDYASNEFKPGWMASELPFEPGDRLPSDYHSDEGVTFIDAETIRKWDNEGTTYLMVDVRTPGEIEQNGRPVGSVNVPMHVRDEENNWILNPDLVSEIERLAGGKDARILTICTLSMRAGHVATMLTKEGFSDVQAFKYGIQGRVSGYGILEGWRAHNLPYEYPEEISTDQD